MPLMALKISLQSIGVTDLVKLIISEATCTVQQGSAILHLSTLPLQLAQLLLQLHHLLLQR